MSNANTPMGSIVASVLRPNQFAIAANDPEKFDGRRSTWAPADGREVSGSKYAEIAHSTCVPDLRGMFLRGLNYTGTNNLRKDGCEDPNGTNRCPGDFQNDTIKSHRHNISGQSGSVFGKGDTRCGHIYDPGSHSDTYDTGDEESRPKNVSVFYYVRIN